MADTVDRLRRDLMELRQDVMELAAAGTFGEAGIPLEVFARLVGFAAITIAKDLRSKDPIRRARWPVFYRPAEGGDEHTTAADLRRWREERCQSTSPVSAAVMDALSRRAGARRRTA